VAQIENEGGTYQPSLTLYQVVHGSTNPPVIARGQPDVYFTKNALWDIRLENSFGGGTVGRRIGGALSTYPSGYTSEKMHWTTSPVFTMVATMDGEEYNNYVRRFQNWVSSLRSSSSPEWTVPIDSYIHTSPTQYTATFKKEYNITFQNSFVGVGNAGVLKVGGVTYTLPTSDFPVIEEETISAQIVYNLINGIEYVFDHWSDGSTSIFMTLTPDDHTTYTAYYIGYPYGMRYYGLQENSKVGQNIRLYWNEHPNPNVTQYQVWRRVRNPDGSMTDPVLLATLNRGTTSWTDPLYIKTPGHTNAILFYDVRAYYALEQTYATPWWLSVFGEPLQGPEVPQFALVERRPDVYSFGGYPNPFNPSTQINFDLPEAGNVLLVIYDVLGREVANLADGYHEAGYHSATWNPEVLSSGVYFARFTVTSAVGEQKYAKINKLVLMK
jgi:hypothetical protein